MIIFLACTKRKQNHPCKAKEMYSASSLFKKGWEYALSLQPDAIYILSAKYGLLEPDDEIEPYEQTLAGKNDKIVRRWSINVARQIISKNIDLNDEAIFLCGKNYRKYISNLFPNRSAPLAHLGIGQQMEFYKNKINKK